MPFPPSSQRQEWYLIQEVPSARAAWVQRYSCPVDSTGEGLLPAYLTISNPWQLSITPPNTQPEQRECFSEPFTEPPPHLYLTRLSQYSQEKHGNKKYPNLYTTQHMLIPEGRQTTSNSYKVWLSPFLALLVSQTPQAGFRSCEVKGHESTWCPSSMGSSRHVLEQGWGTKRSRWPADYTSPKP